MDADIEPQVYDVDATNFEQDVLQASQEQVVVVDFWAPWCGPCKTLGPMLEEVVRALGPGIALAKVNVDENQELAMAFRVQSIPSVKIVRGGRLVQEFTGALPRAQIEALLRPLVPAAEGGQDDALSQAEALAEAGDLRRAARLFEKALADKPDEGKAKVGLARIRLREGKLEEAEKLATGVEQGTPAYDRARAVLSLIGIRRTCEQAGGGSACAARLLANPDDLEARYQAACCAAAEEDYGRALAEWLAIVERKRDFRNGAAREAMVAVFHHLGRDHQLVADYPQRLYRTLY
jgi:putative thioredoxin